MIKTAKDMKKLLIAYNKSVRKLVYKAVSKMKKADMLALIEKDFNIIEKKMENTNINIKVEDSQKYTNLHK